MARIKEQNTNSGNINNLFYDIENINNTYQAYPTAKYKFVYIRAVCHLSSYLKYFTIGPIVFLGIFIINLCFLNVAIVGFISFIMLLIFSFLFFVKHNEYERLKSDGRCYAMNNRIFVLDQDTNYILEYQIDGICPMKGCNHKLHLVKTFKNQENHDNAIACYNSPPHLFRFNLFSDEGELIILTPVPKNPRN